MRQKSHINLRFADDNDALTNEEHELEALVENLESKYGNKCKEVQIVDKHHQWYPEKDLGKRTKVWNCNCLQ